MTQKHTRKAGKTSRKAKKKSSSKTRAKALASKKVTADCLVAMATEPAPAAPAVEIRPPTAADGFAELPWHQRRHLDEAYLLGFGAINGPPLEIRYGNPSQQAKSAGSADKPKSASEPDRDDLEALASVSSAALQASRVNAVIDNIVALLLIAILNFSHVSYALASHIANWSSTPTHVEFLGLCALTVLAVASLVTIAVTTKIIASWLMWRFGARR